jgi:sigma-B regulation protein RsbU (phosphoserine phosphatase)
MKLTTKLILILFSCISLIFGGLMLYTHFYTNKELKADLWKEMEMKGMLFKAEAESKQRAVEEIVQNTAIALELNTDPQIQQALLYQVVARNAGEVYGMCWAQNATFNPQASYYYNEGNQVMYKNLFDTSYNYTTKDWFRNAMLTQKAEWSNFYWDKNGGETLMSTYAFPVKDKHNKVKYVLTGDLSLIWLTEVLHKSSYAKEHQLIFITDEDSKKIIAQPTLTDRNTDFQSVLNNSKALLEWPEHKVLYSAENKGNKYYILTIPIDQYNWCINVVFDYKIVEEQLSALTKAYATLFLIGLSVMGLTIFIVSKRTTKPIYTLATVVGEIGKGQLNKEIPYTHWHNEIGHLSNAFHTMREDIIKYLDTIQKTEAQKQRIASELQIGKEIQLSLLPSLEHLHQQFSNITIQGYLSSAKEVGGDLYDCFGINEEQVFFFIGDVSGKGVPAALYMNGIRAYFRAILKQSPNALNTIVARLNTELVNRNDMCMFVTLYCGIINTQTGNVQYINAGHNAPYLMNASDTIISLKSTIAPALGIIEEASFTLHQYNMAAGDRLFMFTDGLTDAQNIEGIAFSEQQLESVLQSCIHNNTEIMESVVSAIDHYVGHTEPFDDITILTIKYL